MLEVVFLVVLALIWMIFASIQDLRSREVANWLSFSLVIFVLGFRFFYSLFSPNGFDFFYQGLIGLGIFFILGNLFYYGRMFAGADAKLMIVLGAVLPFSESFFVNRNIFALFFFLFLFVGAFYGLSWSLFLAIKNFNNFKKEFSKRLKMKRKFIFSMVAFSIILIAFGFLENLLFFLGVFIFLISYLYLFAKAVDEVCMVKNLRVKDLTEGDWLYRDIKVGRVKIKACWDGLSPKEIKLLKKTHKKVKIRQGIPYIPVFLISFLVLLYVWFYIGGIYLIG